MSTTLNITPIMASTTVSMQPTAQAAEPLPSGAANLTINQSMLHL
jgi:hypothetical protein